MKGLWLKAGKLESWGTGERLLAGGKAGRREGGKGYVMQTSLCHVMKTSSYIRFRSISNNAYHANVKQIAKAHFQQKKTFGGWVSDDAN